MDVSGRIFSEFWVADLIRSTPKRQGRGVEVRPLTLLPDICIAIAIVSFVSVLIFYCQGCR